MKKSSSYYHFSGPGLIDIQLRSFNWLIRKGIVEVLDVYRTINDPKDRYILYLYPEQYRLRMPRYATESQSSRSKRKNKNDLQQAQKVNTGFVRAPLYVPMKLVDKVTGRTQKRDYILLANIPFMNERGGFILNGYERVIINQIVRSPGIYYSKSSEVKNKKTWNAYTATIIPNFGTWLRIGTRDSDGHPLVWISFDKVYKIPISIFLRALGLTDREICQSIRHIKFLGYTFDTSDPKIGSQYAEMRRVELKLAPYKGKVTPHLAPALEKILDNRSYDLGLAGRYHINRKLNINIPSNIRLLTSQDILAAVNYLINLEYNKGEVDDIDHLKNRRVKSVGELLQNQIRMGLRNLEKSISNKMSNWDHTAWSGYKNKNLTLGYLITPDYIDSSLREFLSISPIAQYADQTNCLAEITHKRRLSSIGPGGVSKDRAGLAVRNIHPSHYGRICPVETPEGPNAGLVGTLATYASVNKYGFIEAPFYTVHSGKVLYEKGPVYLTADEEDKVHVATGDIRLNKQAEILYSLVPVRKNQEFITVSRDQVEYIAISPTQVISIATCLIPFLEHDDANRALMGSNMQRQAVPLIAPSIPIVGTGMEAKAARIAGRIIVSTVSGRVSYVSGSKIELVRPNGRTIQYNLTRFGRSNQETCINQRPIVRVGEKIKPGDILADGASTQGGELALGQNITIAYMPWEGYNFEDAILISDRLVSEDVCTSIHIEKYEIELVYSADDKKRKRNEILIRTKDLIETKMESLNQSSLDELGIVVPGTLVKGGDILVRKVTPNNPSEHPEARLLRAIFGEKPSEVRDCSKRMSKNNEGRVIDIRIYNRHASNEICYGGNWWNKFKQIQGLVWISLPTDKRKKKLSISSNQYGLVLTEADTLIRIYIAQKRAIQVGDKMAGRHGNKGIVSRILPRQDMPYLPDGTPVDMVLNPLGVPSRMNVGQTLECLLGWAGSHLGERYQIMPFDELHGIETSRRLVYSKLYEARKKTGKEWLFNTTYPGKCQVFDGRTGEPFDQMVTVGCAYMLKLVHLVDDKIHARSTGPYSLVTQQPLQGKAKHGGQRLGEMEVWALEGFGAAYTLQELLTLKSDDMQGRNEILSSIVRGQKLPTPGTPESFKVLIRELQSLCLNVVAKRTHSKGGFMNVDVLNDITLSNE